MIHIVSPLIHIKKKVCLCGYILCKRSRKFTKVVSPSVSTVSVEPSGACAEKTGCAVLSTSPNDVTNTSLDPSTSVGLLNDTAHDVRCSTTTGEKLDDSNNTPKPEEITEKAHVYKGSLSQPSVGSAKWARRSAAVNEKRRLKYRLNPKGKRLSSKKIYQSQSNIRSQQVLRAYHLNQSPAKKRMLDAYHANPSPIKRKARDAYHANPSPIKQRVLDAYHRHPSPVKQRALGAYKANPSPIKRRALEAYYKEHDLNKGKKRQLYKKTTR